MRRFRSSSSLLCKLAVVAFMGGASAAHAAPPTLKDAVEAAWSRQPEARALHARLDEAAAKRGAASSLFPGAPSIGLSQRTDRFNQDRGEREIEAEIAVPLWMPGTRNAAQRLAAAETTQLDAKTLAARLKIAGEVREAYWQARFAQNDRDVALRKVSETGVLLEDVARRFKAGDLARADLNQAQVAERLARAMAAEAEARALRSQRLFTALTGLAQVPETGEALPDAGQVSSPHPLLAASNTAVEVGQARLAQASAERRDAPEVALGFVRERPAGGDGYDKSVRFAVRIPLATQARNAPRVTAANAELIEAQAALSLEHERLLAESDAAKSEFEQAKAIETLAQERFQLASETQGLYAKAFKLGELDLPTRLRSENDRFEAELALTRARLEVGRAISKLNQALGLIP
ncbi:TolC family protein [Noviherbaspirillum sp. CPCC 100848]|uniref:TolC family protein n=1 Tax=Noviherbaspirillum album TaxID=3080276 RepID=A0ABU6JEZ2_9BURK|nr:TolC family protein [Noviherbaspirillum sp. CPCC 100848]MEC4722240.1 TolC family protein [Noviherbaspirillum sp. CPCC 100848]